MRSTLAKIGAVTLLSGVALFAGATTAGANTAHHGHGMPPRGAYTVGGDADGADNACAVGGDALAADGFACAVGGNAFSTGGDPSLGLAVGGDAGAANNGWAFATGGDGTTTDS